jgi:HAD superfamily hydrolase (TIGR01509 family)
VAAAPAAAVEAVAFDWDGTLVDSKRVLVASFQATTEELLGEPFPTEEADVEEFVQIRGEDAFARIAKGDPELLGRIEAVFHRHYTELSLRAAPFPGTLEALERLRAAGLPIGVATSKARIRLDLEMERTGIGALVDVAIAGDEVRAAKPDPECVREVIRRLGARPAATLYVGDGPNDVRAARGAGAIAVAVSFGFHPELVRAERPDHLIDSLAELVEIAGVRSGAA